MNIGKGWLSEICDKLSSAWNLPSFPLGFNAMSAKCDTNSCPSLASMKRTYQACASSARESSTPRIVHRHRGSNLAARYLGQEIRNVTQKVTGKDLAELRHNPKREQVLGVIEHIRTAVAKTKYDFTDFSVDFGKSLLKTLALESSGESGVHLYSNVVKLKQRNAQEAIKDKVSAITTHTDSVTVSENLGENETLQFQQPELLELNTVEEVSSAQLHMEDEVIKPCKCPSLRKAAEEWLNANKVDFCWQHRGIPDQEFDEYWTENQPSLQSHSWKPSTLSTQERGWQKCFDSDKYSVWKKPLEGTSTYRYRVQAHFEDVKPKHMYRVQTDCELRKEWDNYVQKLEVIDCEPQTNSELIHWITDCPYPMTAREYLYKRRSKIDEQNRTMMVFSELEPDLPLPKTSAFRVNRYESKLLLKSREESFDEAGTDMILMYYDDPESRAPSYVLNKAATYGISMMMDNIHKTAKRLEREESEE